MEIRGSEVEKQPKKPLRNRLSFIGPGAIVTASFIGPGTVTMSTKAGASYGYALLWAVLFSIIATIVLQEMSARLGIIARKSLGDAIREQFDHKILKFGSMWLAMIAVSVGCAAYVAGDLIGTSLGITTLTGIPENILGPIFGVIILILGLSGSYKLVEKVMIFLVVVMSITFITTAIVSQPDIGALLRGTFVPSIPAGSIIMVIALIGTTVVPYNLFIHSSTVMEKWNRANHLRESRWDLIVSIGVGGIITAAIVITAGTTIFGVDVQSAADLSLQLEPLLGDWAKVFISLGLFAAGFSSALASPLGAAITVSSVLNWKDGMKDKRYKMVFTVVVLIGIIFTSLGIQPMSVLLFAQALNGILLPIIAIFLLIVTNNKKFLGNFTNSLPINIAGFIVAIICIGLGLYSLIDVIQTIL